MASVYLRAYASVRGSARIAETQRYRSPFVIGLFRPRIVLPECLDPEIRACVLAHERSQIARGATLRHNLFAAIAGDRIYFSGVDGAIRGRFRY